MGNKMLDRPYFMENRSLFYFDFKERKFKLTKYAPEKAEKSYKEFYDLMYKK